MQRKMIYFVVILMPYLSIKAVVVVVVVVVVSLVDICYGFFLTCYIDILYFIYNN